VTGYSGSDGVPDDDPIPATGPLTISNTCPGGGYIDVYIDGQYYKTFTMFYYTVEDTPDCGAEDEATLSVDLAVGQHRIAAYQEGGYWEFTANVTQRTDGWSSMSKTPTRPTENRRGGVPSNVLRRA
jgi:hypothetical protein